MPGVGLQGLQEDAESPGQAGHGHRQGEEAAQQGHSRLTFVAKFINSPPSYSKWIYIFISEIYKKLLLTFFGLRPHILLFSRDFVLDV